jgi:hypothetical protein
VGEALRERSADVRADVACAVGLGTEQFAASRTPLVELTSAMGAGANSGAPYVKGK